MTIKSEADKAVYYSMCYNMQCAATYGPNPDAVTDENKVDETCKNMCIGNAKKRNPPLTGFLLQQNINECYAYSCMRKKD